MKKHVFLIDDDTEGMKFFVAALKQMGDSYKCTYASSGAHALKMLQYLTPETIFINYNISTMNALELTEAIRKNKELKLTPVFLYFTQIDPVSREKALTMGATDCIQRPDNNLGMTTLLKSVIESQADFFSFHSANT